MATTKDRRINLYINGKEVRNNIKSIAGEYKKSKRELSKLTRGTEEYNRKAAEVRKLKGYLDEHNQKIRQTQSRWQKAIGTVKNLLPAFGFAAIIGGTTRLIQKWAQWRKQLEKTRSDIHQLTGLTGDALDNMTAKTQATAKTFNKDTKEITKAANSLAKQMNISFDKSMELIQDGFTTGADISGEFLDMLNEYPAVFDEIGLNADQTIAVMSQQVKDGVFSDKGVDALKEANIRIREMTDATREAFDAIGMDADKVQEQLVSGDKSMFQIIQKVSGKLDELPPQSEKVGQAIADIFGGPGEDAGMKYLSTLEDINLNLEEVKEKTGDYAKLQGELADANERVSSSMADIFGEGSVWMAMKVQFKEWLAGVLEQIQSVPFTLNRIGKNINDLVGKELFDVKSLKEYQDILFQVNPEFRKLSNQVKEYGILTEKGEKAMDKLAKRLIQTYGKEGQELALQYNKQLREAAYQRKLDQKQEELAIKAKTKARKEDKEVTEEKSEEEEEIRKEAIRKEKQLAEKIKEIRRDLKLSEMSPEAKEIQQAQWKYDRLIQEAEGYAQKQKKLEELKGREIQGIRDKYEQKRAESRREAEEKIQNVLTTSKEKEINEVVKKYEDLIKLARKYGFDTAELYEKLNQQLDKIAEEHKTEGPKTDIFGMTDQDWSEMQSKVRVAQQMAGELSMAWGAYNRMRQNQMQKELDQFERTQQKQEAALERRLEAGIISEKEANQQREQLEQQLNEKKAKLAKEQAQREKSMKTFQAITDTAAAIVGYLADPGGLLGVALSAMAGATGATQIAAIQSQPIPQYEEGGRVKKNQVIEVAEGDKEEGVLSNKTLTDPETAPMANYLLDKQAGISTQMPDTGAIDKAADYNNYKKQGGGFQQKTENHYHYNNTDPGLKQSVDEMVKSQKETNKFISDPNNRRAYISNDIQKEHEEEQQILSEINTAK